MSNKKTPTVDDVILGIWHWGYNSCNEEKNHKDGYDSYEYSLDPSVAKSQLQSLVKSLVDEVVGENDRDYSKDNADEESLRVLMTAATACNNLRNEQRERAKQEIERIFS